MTEQETPRNTGRIHAIQGSVVDISFPDLLPAVFNELRVGDLVLEVQAHLDGQTVRALAMGPTRGLARGQEVVDTC